MISTKRVLWLASAVILMLGGLTAIPTVAAQQGEAATPARNARALAALNDCIQQRFNDVDKRFGIARVMKLGATPHQFEPENVRELEAVRGLSNLRLRVVLYLAGRRLLRPRPPEPSPQLGARGWGIIKGPVQIAPVTSREANPPPPAAMDLWDQGRRALLAFGERESYDFRAGDWAFMARPVRVSGAECLKCHLGTGTHLYGPPASGTSSLKIGDPLGAVIYAYMPLQ
jgi:hypothetical protein